MQKNRKQLQSKQTYKEKGLIFVKSRSTMRTTQVLKYLFGKCFGCLNAFQESIFDFYLIERAFDLKNVRL
jgi:hypothetical protein